MTEPFHVIIMWNHLFSNYVVYGPNGSPCWDSQGAWKLAQASDVSLHVKNMGFKEVPINSKIGQSILRRIGGQTTQV